MAMWRAENSKSENEDEEAIGEIEPKTSGGNESEEY